MERQLKIISGASILTVVLLFMPVVVSKLRHNRDVALWERKPRSATAHFRQKVDGFDRIDVYFGVAEADTPGNILHATRRPDLVLRGEEASNVVRALHFEWRDGQSAWRRHDGPYAGAIFGCTALEFRVGQTTLADLRVGTVYGGGLGARWYAPPQYLADATLLAASRDFLVRQFSRGLTGI